MNESLQTAMTRLRLSGMAASLDVRLQEAAGHHLGHGEFLELVLQDELLVRNERLVARRTKRRVRRIDRIDQRLRIVISPRRDRQNRQRYRDQSTHRSTHPSSTRQS